MSAPGTSGADRPTGAVFAAATGGHGVGDPPATPAAPYDPLRLCVYATVALIAWVAGPLAVLGFAALGFVGYWRARRAGLVRSRCLLRDTRLVLAYLAVLAAAGLAGVLWRVLT